MTSAVHRVAQSSVAVVLAALPWVGLTDPSANAVSRSDGAVASDHPEIDYPTDHRYLAAGGFGSPLISMVGVGRDGSMGLASGSPYPTGPLSLALAITPDARTLYSTHAGSGTIVGYRIGRDGTLSLLPEATVVVGSPVIGAAITPDGSRLFVTTGPTADTGAPGSVRSFSLGPSGSLEPTGAPAVPVDSELSQVIVTPDSRHLVVTNFMTDSIVSFAIGDGSRLSQIGEPLPTGERPALPGITPDGRYLYVGNEGSGDMSGYSIDADGVLRPTPGSPYPAGLEPHGVTITADSGRVYSVDVGLASGAVPTGDGASILGWRVEDGGRLVALPDSPYPTPGLGGRVVLSPDDQRIYHLQSIATDNLLAHSHVHGYSLDGQGRPVDDGRPSLDTGIVFHDGATAFFTPNQGPVAALEQTSGRGLTVDLSAAGSHDPDGRVVSFHWRFGDGTSTTTTNPQVSHRFPSAGDWDVEVTVIDDEGCSTETVFGGTVLSCRGGEAARSTLSVRTP